MKQVFFDGFDNYEDYVKYGDLFPYEPTPKEQEAWTAAVKAKAIHLGPTP